MLWRRRNEGFEWKEYVRTTVLLRRKQRRDRLDAAGRAAAEGLIDAGRKGVAIGAAGAEAAGRGAAAVAGAAAKGVVRGTGASVRTVGSVLSAARTRIANASEPLNARLARPAVSRILLAVAALTIAFATARTVRFGFDTDAAVIAAVAVLTTLAWSWPRLFAHRSDEPGEPEEDATPATANLATSLTTRLTRRVLDTPATAASLIPLAAAASFAGLMVWLAAPVVHGWITSPSTPAAPSPAARSDADLVGDARVVGPGRLRIGTTDIALDAVTMLDPDQSCRKPDGAQWSCGAEARRALEKRVRGRRAIACTFAGENAGLRTATCRDGDTDIAAELVRDGHAFADGWLWPAYQSAQSEAEAARAGLWAGEPERPDAWRQRLFEEASATAPGGCPIKGRVNGNRKTYLIPGDTGYARTSLRETRGDRWFCSADDARTAGFAPASRD